jgi:hypothetical protein
MRSKLFTVISIFFVSGLLLLTAIEMYGDNLSITKDNAISIANKKVTELGYDIKSMDVEVSLNNTPWNECLPQYSGEPALDKMREKLVNKEYWFVYYSPKPQGKNDRIFGGDLCIFIDSKTGEIIMYLRGK